MKTRINQGTSWLKNQFESIAQQFELSWTRMTEYGIAFSIGMIIGFLIKRYGKQAFLTIIVIGVLLASLSHFHLATIDWLRIKDFVGLGSTHNIEGFFRIYVNWAQQHIITVAIGAVGFIIGCKVG